MWQAWPREAAEPSFMYRIFYAIRILGAVLMLGVAGLLILTLLGVDTGLFRR